MGSVDQGEAAWLGGICSQYPSSPITAQDDPQFVAVQNHGWQVQLLQLKDLFLSHFQDTFVGLAHSYIYLNL
jgi:hypothetical protein